MRTTISFLVLFPVLVWFRSRQGGQRGGCRSLLIPRADLFPMILLGVVGTAAANYFYYLAIQRTNVATAIMLQYTAPVWVLLYLAARGRHKPTAKQYAAVALAVAGIAVLMDLFGSAQFHLDQIGVAAAIVSAFAFAFYNVAAHRVLERYDRWTVLLYVLGSAALFWAIVDPPWKIIADHFSRSEWWFLILFALVSALAPFALYIAGLEYLEPTRAMIASCTEPVFSIGIAALALGELVRPVQMLGIAMVLGAIVVVELPTRKGRTAVAVIEPIE
jgi:drug/metabolite transporter (DMT)-like permease